MGLRDQNIRTRILNPLCIINCDNTVTKVDFTKGVYQAPAEVTMVSVTVLNSLQKHNV